MKFRVWCNGHGWVWAESPDKIHFTMSKSCAKEYSIGSKELLSLRMRIEHTIMCNYDLVY